MKRAAALLAAAATIFPPSIGRCQQPPGVPAVDATGKVHSRRLSTGAPLGGLGAGSFQIYTDGTFGPLTLPDGFRPNANEQRGSFAAIWTSTRGHGSATVLALANAYGLPSAPAVDYSGLYPTAALTYPNLPAPAEVTVTGFSPIIPFDLDRSCMPGAIIVLRLHNSTDDPVDVSAALSWQRLLRTSAGPGSSVISIPDREGFFGLRFPDTSVQPDEQFDNGAGGEALMVHPPRQAVSVTYAGWSAAARPAWWDRFAADGTVGGEADSVAGLTVPAGVVAVKLTLKPRDTVEIPFAVTWYTPHDFVPSGQDLGHYYQSVQVDAQSVATSLLDNWEALYALTQEWQNRLLFSSLPAWMKMRDIDSAAVLSTNTILTKDGRFAWATEIGDMPAAAGDAAISAAGAAARRIAADALMLDFYPQLVTRELDQTLDRVTPEGLFLASSEPELLTQLRGPRGNTGSNGTVGGAGAPSRAVTSLDVDRTSVFMLRAAQYYLATEDERFLEESFARLRSATEYLARTSGDDGMPAASGPDPASVTLWVAALGAGERLCDLYRSQLFLNAAAHGIAGNWADALAAADVAQQFRDVCVQTGTRARRYIATKLFNGRFLVERGTVAPAALSGQAIGEWAAGRLGLEPILTHEVRLAVIHSLKLLTGSDSPLGPADRAPGSIGSATTVSTLPTALLGEAGLFLQDGDAEAGVAMLQTLDASRNNALLSPWESPLRFDAKTGAALAPGLGSLAQAADWSDLKSLEGYRWDPILDRLTVSPSIPGAWRSFAAPLFGSTFWGRIDFKPLAHSSLWTLRLERMIALVPKSGGHGGAGRTTLLLRSVRIPDIAARPAAGAISAQVTLRQNAIGSRQERDPSGDIIVTFDTPITLSAGDRLEVELH